MTSAKKATEHLGLIAKETEKAAHDIIHSCEELQSFIEKFDGNADLKIAMKNAVSSIVQSCTFQDIVSQRSKIITDLISTSMTCSDQAHDDAHNLKEGPATNSRPPLSQDDIDSLLD